jgi:uncharacterized protein (DUF1800 family)
LQTKWEGLLHFFITLPPSNGSMADQLTSQLHHLYRRTAFGARPEDIAASVPRGYPATVDFLLDRARPDAGAVALPVLDPATNGTADTLETRKELNKLKNDQERQIVEWWLERMTLSEQGGIEKLTFFWHDHFATSANKVNNPHLMLAQNETLRRLGGGNFEELTQAIAKDGAMMIWLDSNKNNKNNPNENFSRELMELFTIGIGNYSDADVREAARSFAGWRFNRSEGFQVRKNQQDLGNKTLLGKSGAFTGEQVVSLLVKEPATARYITAKLWRQYAYPIAVDSPIVAELAAGFAADLNITKLLRSILLHPQFVSADARRGLVKQPVEWMIGAMRQLDIRPSQFDIDRPRVGAVLRQLNQEPFFPPSVGGWPDNGYWISTSSALARYRFALSMTSLAKVDWFSGADNKGRLVALASRLGVDEWTPNSAEAISQIGDPRRQLAAALVTPEYVLN